MTTAWTLMTALPPTKGHLNLIRFGASLADQMVAIVTTQSGEPYARERYEAIKKAAADLPNVKVRWLHRELEQDATAPGFWNMWKMIMFNQGMRKGDIFCSSELYGATMAKVMGGVFMPYDPNRELYYTKATLIREKMDRYFHDILPEFQQHLVSRITVFGAESTGKTTLSKELAYMVNGHWLFEWARPYLESTSPDITIPSMTAIWKGQNSIQQSARYLKDKPFIIQDTDLFSTVGYWEQPHWTKALGRVPPELVKDAFATKSDLYIITRSNIAFEADPLRYGGDHRESPDEYWIGVAEKYGLNYMVLEPSEFNARASWAAKYSKEIMSAKAKTIDYTRSHNA